MSVVTMAGITRWYINGSQGGGVKLVLATIGTCDNDGRMGSGGRVAWQRMTCLECDEFFNTLT